MTNKEYIEKNKISFSEAMKMYDNKKYPCINDWLNQEHITGKFKIGDILGPGDGLCKDKIFFVIDYDDKYLYVKEVNRNGDIVYWTGICRYDNKYKEDHSIKVICKHEQDYFKKIA